MEFKLFAITWALGSLVSSSVGSRSQAISNGTELRKFPDRGFPSSVAATCCCSSTISFRIAAKLSRRLESSTVSSSESTNCRCFLSALRHPRRIRVVPARLALNCPATAATFGTCHGKKSHRTRLPSGNPSRRPRIRRPKPRARTSAEPPLRAAIQSRRNSRTHLPKPRGISADKAPQPGTSTLKPSLFPTGRGETAKIPPPNREGFADYSHCTEIHPADRPLLGANVL